jgi:hypothetical protein
MPAAMMRGLAHELESTGRYRDPLEVARERGIEILQHYRPEPLADDKARELAAILKAADRELRS